MEAFCKMGVRGTLPSEDPLREPPSLDVTAALIVANGRIFIAQRAPHQRSGLLWEFPGGKVEEGESLERALQREIREELCWGIQVGELFRCVHHVHEHRALHLHAFWCSISEGNLCLKEHIDCHWALPDELNRFEFTSPDEEIISFLAEMSSLPDVLKES
jgi:8-oxo-dGTP diphosphatase